MKYLSACTFCAAALLFASCSTIEEARKAQDGKSMMPGERTLTPEELGMEEGKTYDLPELERVALFASPAVFQARQNLIYEQLQLKIVKADYLPTVDANAGYEIATYNEKRRGQSWNTRGNGYGGVSFELLVYDFGKTDAAVAQQIQGVIAARRSFFSLK